MDQKVFFDALRGAGSPLGSRISQAQVDGVLALLSSMDRNGVEDPHHAANILAQVTHETGGYMLPIKETVYRSHQNKNPSDATVKRRLENAWRSGRLPWVKTPYWRDGAFGRGPIQTTHWRNYEKMGARLGLPLRQNPELLLVPEHGADSAVVGMMEGLYTGKKLPDFSFPSALVAHWRSNPRRIVNGKDGTDTKIAGYHRAYYAALMAAGWGTEPVAVPEPAPPLVRPEPDSTHQHTDKPIEPPQGGFFHALLQILKGLFK